MPYLIEIAEHLRGQLTGNPLSLVHNIYHSSQDCTPESLFVAIIGEKTNGHNFIQEALEHGAIGIISELSCPTGFPKSWIQVKDVRLGLAQAAAMIYGNPSKKLHLVGITGTNGKTTTAYLLDSIFRTYIGISAMMGTIESRIGNSKYISSNTTPEAPQIQRFLQKAVEANCKYAVMEVSSHSIDLQRVHSLYFDAAIFTNLTQDHLDYHRTMENYFEVKQKLFDGSLGAEPEILVINRDDPYGEKLLNNIAGNATKLSYGIFKPRLHKIDTEVSSLSISSTGLNLKIKTLIGPLECSSRLIGQPHAYNLLAAITTALALGISKDSIISGVANVQVPGRFERVDDGSSGFTVIVDYAHTPDAISNTLKTAREFVSQTKGRIIILFGCGGNRDNSKRQIMAEQAAIGSDLIIATSDNPRSEDPEKILDDIEIGLRKVGKLYHRIADRRHAIEFALSQAVPGDIVILAGKGHENYQILKDQTIYFDDREVAREILEQAQKPRKNNANY